MTTARITTRVAAVRTESTWYVLCPVSHRHRLHPHVHVNSVFGVLVVDVSLKARCLTELRGPLCEPVSSVPL